MWLFDKVCNKFQDAVTAMLKYPCGKSRPMSRKTYNAMDRNIPGYSSFDRVNSPANLNRGYISHQERTNIENSMSDYWLQKGREEFFERHK